MTEDLWLSGTDIFSMLKLVAVGTSIRKLRLFVVACCRVLHDETTPESARHAVEVLERGADGLADENELKAAGTALAEASLWMVEQWDLASGAWSSSLRAQARAHHAAADATVEAALKATIQMQIWARHFVSHRKFPCDLLREIVGNPFRHSPLVLPDWLAWADGTVSRMAKEIYQERSFASLPVLADALEDAGCTTRALLTHLRSPGPHVRGCWALDLILGKQ
jgi:hypothetical protein